MDIIYVLVPLSIVLIGIATLVFFWAVRNGQFDDMDSPAHKILFDDDEPSPQQSSPQQSSPQQSSPQQSSPQQSSPQQPAQPQPDKPTQNTSDDQNTPSA